MKFVKKLPPRVTGPGGTKYMEDAQRLSSRPGEWALWKVFPNNPAASTAAHQLRNGKAYNAFRPVGHFDAAARGNEVYVRYVGKKKG